MIRSIASLTILNLLVSTGLPSCGKLNFDPQRSSSSEEFSPQSISGLSFWLRSDVGVNYALMKVDSWTDSVSGMVFTPTSAMKADYVASDTNFNGKPTITFNANSPTSLVYSGSNAPSTYLCNSGYTVMMVNRAGYSFSGSQALKEFIIVDPSNNEYLFLGSSYQQPLLVRPKYRVSIGTQGQLSTSSLPLSAIGTFMTQVTMEASSGSGLVWNGNVDPSPVGSAPSSYLGTCGSFAVQLGLSGATNSGLSSVAFAEILIYDRVLSAGELSQVGCYLKNKYAIAAYTGTCN